MLSVSDRDVSPLSIAVGDANVPEVKKKTTLSVPIKLTRGDGAKADCTLRARDLPPQIKAAEVKIAKDKSEGTLAIQVSEKAATGTFSLWLQAETKIKVKANPQALERAQAYRAHLQKLHDDPAQAPQLEAIQAAIKVADQRVEAAKAGAKDQDLTVFIPSPHLTFRVTDP